jgi:hypothetical protein
MTFTLIVLFAAFRLEVPLLYVSTPRESFEGCVAEGQFARAVFKDAVAYVCVPNIVGNAGTERP